MGCEGKEMEMISKFLARAAGGLNLPFTQESVGGTGFGDENLPSRWLYMGV